ncbi:MAG: hypothetical protein KJ970_16930 [Candidatus Eisenbacteria bacterium]|uniref:Uncharacterized protein n=1 Tax=Eiseniibacteriota bacterium TaxID=2212470 RepID=A0A948RY52_UNCEI|nr:hypothetical protein [Candidatus Eisenbacteria bacterium]MBU1950185.1 hypothetical protein [Candidatus Eisenbacteria bacterium]MBU2692601.1 hypothetical protein [Candidatus Eisenbacteria bacterium]
MFAHQRMLWVLLLATFLLSTLGGWGIASRVWAHTQAYERAPVESDGDPDSLPHRSNPGGGDDSIYRPKSCIQNPGESIEVRRGSRIQHREKTPEPHRGWRFWLERLVLLMRGGHYGKL